jgi:hypothetical protein
VLAVYLVQLVSRLKAIARSSLPFTLLSNATTCTATLRARRFTGDGDGGGDAGAAPPRAERRGVGGARGCAGQGYDQGGVIVH